MIHKFMITAKMVNRCMFFIISSDINKPLSVFVTPKRDAVMTGLWSRQVNNRRVMQQFARKIDTRKCE